MKRIKRPNTKAIDPRINPAIESPLGSSLIIPMMPKIIAIAGITHPIMEKPMKMSEPPKNVL